VHFRWPWNDPADPKYAVPRLGLPLNFASTMGFTVPPYPSSLKVVGLTCEVVAVLEFQDGTCPWYYVMIPNSAWPTSGTIPKIVFRYPDDSKNLYTNSIQLPPAPPTSTGSPTPALPTTPSPRPPSAWIGRCRRTPTSSTRRNPGPGYQSCGGDVKPIDPCSPLQPSGYHTVHFRYIWAGQKTFTMFPKPSLMPKWIELEVNGPATPSRSSASASRIARGSNARCPTPPSARAPPGARSNKLHTPTEWNTVQPWPLPATPKEYWIRWYYGKPDIPRSVDPPNFKVFDYYPDGSNGDWSATGVWNDSMCAPKPPATPVTVGFGNGAWFPYSKTGYMYPYGGSLAYIYPDHATVQDLFNAFRVGALPVVEAELGSNTMLTLAARALPWSGATTQRHRQRGAGLWHGHHGSHRGQGSVR